LWQNTRRRKTQADGKEVSCLPNNRVLVVEDDPALIELLRLLLEREGLEVAIAQDGLEALDFLRAERWDLVLLDLHLPKLEGLDVLWEMRNDTQLASLPVVIISVDDSPHTMLQGWRLGVDSYFLKPFDPDELLRVVRRILSLPREASYNV
jgi:two-component system response regulator AdeR